MTIQNGYSEYYFELTDGEIQPPPFPYTEAAAKALTGGTVIADFE
jgi:hypothetical protein